MNILLIAPIFFDYEKIIRKKLEERFEKVFFFCEIPFNSPSKYYALRRFFPKFAQKALVKYNNLLIAFVKEHQVEKILIIRGYGLLPIFLDFAKLNGIQIINYQWDSLKNNPNGIVISEYATNNFSFDILDCNINHRFKHLPLFYTWDNIKKKNPKDAIKQSIDVLFIGTYHSNRHLIADRLKELCEREGLVMYSYIYYPFFLFLRRRLWGDKVKCRDVRFCKLSRQKYYEILCRTRVVLDVQNTEQSGATMRSIETISLERKLISTNNFLKYESFYNSSNILLWDGLSLNIPLLSFIRTQYNKQSKEKILSLDAWIDKLFM